MLLRRSPTILLLLASVALMTTGCGRSDGETTSAATTAAPAPARVPAPKPRPVDRACGRPPARGAAGSGSAISPVSGRAALDAAAARATETDHRFTTHATVRVTGGLSARATLQGRRTPDNRSTGVLRWSGAASLLLPDTTLRIVDDRIETRTTTPGAQWRDLGSASGIALDVGRELFMHPFLLRETAAARTSDGATLVDVEAPAKELREYASTERHGLVTELLRNAESLVVTARVEDGALVGDRFVLRTQLPTDVARTVGGAEVTVTATTGYCTTRLPDDAG